MAKIAILMYGHLRTYKKTHHSFFKNVIDVNENIDFDIFISTWNRVDVSSGELKEMELFELSEIYKPKNIDVVSTDAENYLSHLEGVGQIKNDMLVNTNFHILNCQEMIYSYEVQHGFKYDYILLTRPDIYFNQNLDLTDLLSSRVRGHIETKNDKSLFYPYIICDHYGQIMDNEKYICGVDLLCIYSRDIAGKMRGWDIKSKEYEDLLPEFAITKAFSGYEVSKKIIGYEKDRSFYIQRSGYSLLYSVLLEPLRLVISIVFYLLLPAFILSGKFRQKIFLNIHLLSPKKLRKLWNFLK